MADLLSTILVAGATFAAVLIAFVAVPEFLVRSGLNPRGARTRAVVWATFLVMVLVPAAVTGYLFTVTNPADWVLFVLAVVVAVLLDYYRLNPGKLPWVRPRT